MRTAFLPLEKVERNFRNHIQHGMAKSKEYFPIGFGCHSSAKCPSFTRSFLIFLSFFSYEAKKQLKVKGIRSTCFRFIDTQKKNLTRVLVEVQPVFEVCPNRHSCDVCPGLISGCMTMVNSIAEIESRCLIGHPIC